MTACRTFFLIIIILNSASGSALLYSGFAITFVGVVFVFMHNRNKPKTHTMKTKEAKRKRHKEAEYEVLKSLVNAINKDAVKEKWNVLKKLAGRDELKAELKAKNAEERA